MSSLSETCDSHLLEHAFTVVTNELLMQSGRVYFNAAESKRMSSAQLCLNRAPNFSLSAVRGGCDGLHLPSTQCILHVQHGSESAAFDVIWSV